MQTTITSAQTKRTYTITDVVCEGQKGVWVAQIVSNEPTLHNPNKLLGFTKNWLTSEINDTNIDMVVSLAQLGWDIEEILP